MSIKNSVKTSVFSLNRFFHGGEKSPPCWLAGCYYPKDELHFQLKSQNLSLICRKTGKEPPLIKEGDWLAVKLSSKEKNNQYKVSEYRLLASSSLPFKASAFSYKSKGRIVEDWESFLQAIRSFFYSEGLTAVETPGLVQCPGTEPHLQAFATKLIIESGARTMYLPTSPEMHLKKLLCQDWTDFFEIKKCFRNKESGPLNQVEFSLLEWYRAFYTTKELMEEVVRLLSFLKTKDFFKAPLPPVKVYTVRELFKKQLDFSLSPATSKEELISLSKSCGLPVSSKSEFEDVFFLVFLNKIELKLPQENPVFVCDYPPQLRAFSRLNERGWADRFELYWRGFELANAFYEVIDPKEQLFLFKKHIRQRKDDVPYDDELLSLMKQGMPPCSGIAMGLDRLFLAVYNKKSLKDIRLFPY